jgi:DNA polymerase-4
MIIKEDMIPKLLYPLPISKVYGLGEKSVKKLNNIGIFTVEELYKLPKELVVEFFGKFGIDIYNRIRGIDTREINISSERKSVGKETTLRSDTKDKEELKSYLRDFSEDISKIFHAKNISGKTITLKIKTSSFVSHTKSKTLLHFISKEEEIFNEACNILNELELIETIRLIGVSISSLKENKIEQLSLF